MKDFSYVIQNFFTHKDYLAPASQIPGTIFTPLHFLFEAILLAIIISSVIYVSNRKHLIKPVFIGLWATLVVWEFIIIAWDSLAGKVQALDLQSGLSLYPCSIYMYAMPFAIWGKGIAKKAACGYVCTLGLLGAAVNFLFPIARLTDYSCISFPGFHTFFYHGVLLFTCLVMLRSHYHTYGNVLSWKQLFYPCIPSLILSIPANIINYSPIDADYMYFKGKFFVLAALFGNLNPVFITIILYALYICVPALFYLPSYLYNKRTHTAKNAELSASTVL